MRKLLIVGAGGFGKEVAWTALEMNRAFTQLDRWEIVGFADDDAEKHGQEIFGLTVFGTLETVAARFQSEELWYHCATGNNENRERLAARLDALGCRAARIIHPSAILAPQVPVGEGSYVGALTIVNPGAGIGKHVLVNQRVAIGHDAVLEDFSQINPGGQINGMCRVGRSALIGSNASLHPAVRVGECAVIGANSQVLRNVPPNTTVNGVPATQTFNHNPSTEKNQTP